MKNVNKYKLIKEESIKNIIEFLDEVQFDAAKEGTTDAMHKVNFCTWAINELLNGFDAELLAKKTNNNKKPQPKSRDQYVDETFMDWNLPDMTDEEYEKYVDKIRGY